MMVHFTQDVPGKYCILIAIQKVSTQNENSTEVLNYYLCDNYVPSSEHEAEYSK